MTVERHTVDNGDGYALSLRRTPAARVARGPKPRPLLIVPGYGMNSFIFSFHPKGASLEASLAARGIEVWSVDLRGQGESRKTAGGAEGRGAGLRAALTQDRYGLADLAGADLAAAVRYVSEHAGGSADGKIDLFGASLGASLVFGYLALAPDAPVANVVSFGGLVTWVKVPALVRAIFYSPGVIGKIPFVGTRRLAGFALPTLARVAPGFLSIYLHTQSTDIEQAAVMIRTVEDPNRYVNREIAEWIERRELVLRGVNVSRALPSMRYPFMCVVAMQDGIVPPETGRALFDAIGSDRKVLLEVGTPEAPIAHADLFLSTGAQETVFGKVADFLIANAPGA